MATVSKGLENREHHCPECGYRTHRDHAAAEMVLHRGLENGVTQGLWGTETACQVGLSGVYDLDKWRGAGMLKSDLGKPALYAKHWCREDVTRGRSHPVIRRSVRQGH
ncbi:hypothetical protein [Leptodesmis sp.]|uniref:hypothetical protein n=1 Tax=Leptodesmis sp. TaxID=3100501 RepID=UPI00405358EC